MIPVRIQDDVTYSMEYILKKNIFQNLKLVEMHYRLDNFNNSSDYLSNSEYEKLKSEIINENSPIHRGKIVSKIPYIKSDYFDICGIKMPYVFYDMIETQTDNVQTHYDYSSCKDYFIMQLDTYDEMTKLINSAEELGYQILYINHEQKIIEMRKSKQQEGF